MQSTPNQLVIFLSGLLFCAGVTGAETNQTQITLSGTIQTLACTQSCGSCCGTHALTDSSGNITLQIGNSFADLARIADDGQIHQYSGHFYTAAGQCGINECSLFAVESIDEPVSAAAVFQSTTGKLSIQRVVIDGNNKSQYAITLEPPYTVDQLVDRDELTIVSQGDDCSAATAVCATGTVCLSYFGIAGASGPEFKSCEIPCSHPGASCPLGQSCSTIADGPGQVCTAD